MSRPRFTPVEILPVKAEFCSFNEADSIEWWIIREPMGVYPSGAVLSLEAIISHDRTPVPASPFSLFNVIFNEAKSA